MQHSNNLPCILALDALVSLALPRCNSFVLYGTVPLEVRHIDVNEKNAGTCYMELSMPSPDVVAFQRLVVT